MKPLECIHTLPNVPIVCQERHGVQQFLKTNVFPSSFVFLSSQQTDQNCTECKAGRWLTTRRMCSQHKSESFPLFAKRLKNMILILFSPPPTVLEIKPVTSCVLSKGSSPELGPQEPPFFFLTVDFQSNFVDVEEQLLEAFSRAQTQVVRLLWQVCPLTFWTVSFINHIVYLMPPWEADFIRQALWWPVLLLPEDHLKNLQRSWLSVGGKPLPPFF